MCTTTIDLDLPKKSSIKCAGCGEWIEYHTENFECDSLCKECVGRISVAIRNLYDEKE
jgi:formylmethanofuran dehydrogenase subunit E